MASKFETHKAKLEYMIEHNYPYEQILKQSQILDKYVAIEMRKRNPLDKG